MKIGVIGYCAKTGIGIMTEDLCCHFLPEKQLVIPHDTAKFLPMSVGRETIHAKQWSPSREEVHQFCRNLDIVLTVETDWGPNTFGYIKEIGPKIAKIVMFEWWNPNEESNKYVDLWICTTHQSYKELPYKNKVFLQWPVDTKRIAARQIKGRARTFVHNAGNLGMKGRKGTAETIKAFHRTSRPDIKLIINAQRSLYSTHEMDIIRKDPRIELRVRNVDDFADLYKEGDVLIYCSKIDGQSMVGLEGCAAGMPVITTDAPPMNEYWTGNYYLNDNEYVDDRLLVKVKRTENAHTTNPNSVHNLIDIEDLSAKIEWCANNDLEKISVLNRQLAYELSWDKWDSAWFKELNKLK